MKTATQTLVVTLASLLLLNCGSNSESKSSPTRVSTPTEPVVRVASDETSPSTAKVQFTGEDLMREELAKKNQEEALMFSDRYSQTGLSGIANLVEKRLNTLNQNRTNAAIKAAESIQDVKIEALSDDSDNIRLTLVLKEANRTLSQTALVGAVNELGTASMQGNLTQGIDAQIICLTRNLGTCFTAYIELTFNNQDGVKVGVLTRATNANYKNSYPDTQNSPRFDRLVEYFKNTDRQANVGNRIYSILVDTFQVINGRSGIRLGFIANNGQTIYVSGNLPKGFGDTYLTNTLLQQDLNLDDLVAYEAKLGQLTTDLMDSIDEIALIQNDGANTLGVQFVVRNNNNVESILNIQLFRRDASPIKTNQEILKLIERQFE